MDALSPTPSPSSSAGTLGPYRGSGRELRFELDETGGRLHVFDDDRLLLGWRFGERVPLPHWFPLRSPSGKDLLTETPEPYPHHQSCWIADKVQLADGEVVDFYHYPKNLRDPKNPASGYRHAIRQQAAPECQSGARRLTMNVELAWLVGGKQRVLRDRRRLELRLLDQGQYLVDLEWSLAAVEGEVRFLSDWVHYGWPFLRLDRRYSVDGGGTLVDDVGRRGQKATNGQYANWMDASATVDGQVEGVAVFVPQDGQWRKWLTRDYGTFGPRRPDRESGTSFVLPRDATLDGRVRLFVHRGDARSGGVAARYREFIRELDR